MDPQQKPSNSSDFSGDVQFINYRERITPSVPVQNQKVSPPTPINLPVETVPPPPSPPLPKTPAPEPAPEPLSPPPSRQSVPLPSELADLPPLPPPTRPELGLQGSPEILEAPAERPVSTFTGALPSGSDPFVSSPSSSQPPRRSDRIPSRAPRSWKRPVVIVVTMLILVAGAYGAYAALLAPGPALPAAFSAIDSATMMHTGVAISLTSDNKQIDGSAFDIESDIDRSNAASPADDSTITLSFSGMTASGEVRLVGDVLYGEVTSVPPAYTAQYAPYTNKWYSVSLSALEAMASSTHTVPVPKGLSLAKIYDSIQAAGILTNLSFAGLGFPASGPVRIYRMTVDKSALAAYIGSVYVQTDTASNTAAMSTSLAASFLANVNFSPITVSTDILTGSLRSVGLDITAQAPATQYSPALAATMHVAATYDDRGLNFTVSAPAGATSLDGFFANSMKGTQSFAKDQHIIADLMQVRTQLESAYADESYPLDCQTPGMIPLRSDLLSQGSSLLCRVSASSYSLTAKMVATSTAGSALYFCIDSLGTERYLSKVPSGYVCK